MRVTNKKTKDREREIYSERDNRIRDREKGRYMGKQTVKTHNAHKTERKKNYKKLGER